MELPIKSTSISVQQQMDELDDELAMSLAEEDQQDEFLVPMLSGEEPVKIKQSSLTDLAWSWSTPDVRKNSKRKNELFLTMFLSLKAVHHISPKAELKKDLKAGDADTDFPDWWDDGKYTKMQKNQTFAKHSKKPSQENVQRILRIIYDIYYKPFKEDRKQFEAFQIKDSWLCATRMTRMQIIKDMYSKQGTLSQT